MITVTELWGRLDELALPLPQERVPLSAALGRILAEPIFAPEDQPAFDRSAIDGYLVNADQAAGIVTLLGTVSPGLPPPAIAPEPGTAWRILTGSALPATAAALVMQEDTRAAARPDQRELLQAPSIRHIRRRASQARAGDRLLTPGQALGPGALALLASLGVVQVLVSRRPRVAHLVTGGELVAPEQVPAPGRIRDCNSTLIAAFLAEAGAELCWHRRVGDARAAAAEALAEALASPADVILVSGGASVGDHDHTGALLAECGFTIHCDKVASRPGKPFIAAAREGRLAFGLPGNPLSHFVCYHLFVKRVLARLVGAAPIPLHRLTLAPGAALTSNPRETWWPAVATPAGYAPLPWADSSDLTVLARASALLRVPADAPPDYTAEGLLV
ncbi:MAG: molybdopterin molybdotransferase MoeA [Verrucomicrobia bacterium]|nr:molybdopterin molybdotransferase MoeA [Verrucomicrobiota bacterium]